MPDKEWPYFGRVAQHFVGIDHHYRYISVLHLLKLVPLFKESNIFRNDGIMTLENSAPPCGCGSKTNKRRAPPSATADRPRDAPYSSNTAPDNGQKSAPVLTPSMLVGTAPRSPLSQDDRVHLRYNPYGHQ